MITHAISGELHDELASGTQLDDGRGDSACWGYGSSRDVDIEVYRMVGSAITKRAGYGYRASMTGSPEAWAAIAEYAAMQGDIERTGDGDFDRGKGTRLEQQAARIRAMLEQVAA